MAWTTVGCLVNCNEWQIWSGGARKELCLAQPFLQMNGLGVKLIVPYCHFVSFWHYPGVRRYIFALSMVLSVLQEVMWMWKASLSGSSLRFSCCLSTKDWSSCLRGLSKARPCHYFQSVTHSQRYFSWSVHPCLWCLKSSLELNLILMDFKLHMLLWVVELIWSFIWEFGACSFTTSGALFRLEQQRRIGRGL